MSIFEAYKNIQVEVQIRTLSQHSWAEASNLFQYKEEASVPKELKRAIGRISALLETVDLEFERILSARENYKEVISERNFNALTESIDFNVDIIEQILTRRLPIANKSNDEDFAQLLLDLNSKGINNTRMLERIIDESLQKTLSEEKTICLEMLENFKKSNQLFAKNPIDNLRRFNGSKERLDKIEAGVYFTYTGLIRHTMSNYFNKYWDDAN